jgi:transposase
LIAARIGESFTAPVLFQGATDALAFNAWLEHQLCPLLDETHVIIMDNASFHKGSETAKLIATTGASLLFLPLIPPS